MRMRTVELRRQVAQWYEGAAYSVNTPDSPVVILPGIRYRRHWTADIARAVVAFHRTEWRWAVPVYLSACGLALAFIKLG